MLIGCLGVVLGVACAVYFPGYFPGTLSLYIGVALLACADSIVGGLLARTRGNYSESIFVSGFFINALLAVGLTYFGRLINLQMELGAVVVFSMRIFQNLAILRRNLLNLSSE